MDMKLRVTPEVLKSKSVEVEDEIKSLESEFRSIQDIVTKTRGYWIGAAGERARTEVDNQKDEIDTILNRFREHPVKLMTMAGVYDEAERQAVEETQALATDVIV